MTVGGRGLLLLVAVVVAAVAGAGIAGRATYGNLTSGDEPHYLLTALSLGHDGDLDVSDETAAEQYRPFHEATIASQAAVRDDGSMVVPHDPLLPAILALPMRWGGATAAKATLALLAGVLAALTTWVAVRRFGVPVRTAAITVVVAGASVPLAGYGHQVYPELPAALATTIAVAALTGRLGATGAAAIALAVTALPWLSVKYVPVAAVLAGLAVLRMLRSRSRLQLGAFVGALVIAGVAYVIAHLAWYGGLTVYAAGDFFAENGGELSVVGTDPSYGGRVRRLVGLLVDRDFGIATWQPLWVLTVPALVALWRRRTAAGITVVAPLAAGWLTATFLALTMQGWWFPGRQVVVVLPAAVVAIAWWAGADRRRVAAVTVLGSVGVANYGRLTADAVAGRVTWIVDFAATGAPLYRALRTISPNYLEVTAATWAFQALWLAVFAALAWCGWRSVEPSGGGRFGAGVGRTAGVGGRATARVGGRTAARSRGGAGAGGGPLAVELAHGGAVVLSATDDEQAGDEGGGGDPTAGGA